MRALLSLPHRVCESTCYVNGLEDVLSWRRADYADYLLSVVGGMAGFTYLRFKRADPPCMVYWGASPKYLMRDLAAIIGFKETAIEGRSYGTSFTKLKSFIDQGQPVVAGAMDMYYLRYYPGLYKKQHVPIHYVLVVGYDDERRVVFVHDCSLTGVQEVPYEELRQAMDVNVPGMSKKNTIRAFTFPRRLPSELEVGRKGFSRKAKKFLKPPVGIFGIPAMRKLAKEILGWTNPKCFEHMATYATTPPTIPKTFENSHGMRFWQASVLLTLGRKYDIPAWSEASEIFRQSGEKISRLCEAALRMDKRLASSLLEEIAAAEEQGYGLLLSV